MCKVGVVDGPLQTPEEVAISRAFRLVDSIWELGMAWGST